MEHLFKNQKPFPKMKVLWRHRIKMLFWKALALLVLMKNGLHCLSVVIVRSLVMSMGQLCCKIRCIYLVETIMDVTLVIFRFWI
uniref:Uncharacterized protein n=1 Tax=Arundo donax TaxID=35708 RepID=A0A0A9ESP0_ARUDO